MKIKSIEVNNYKAFYGKQKFDIAGKNVFIYGENGSGKSSLYYALKDFFQSSTENIDLNEVENIFIEPARQGNCYIKVGFRPDKDGRNRVGLYEFSLARNNTRAAGDTSIRDANHLKSFLTYKHLLGIHHIKKDGEINLFDLLVKGVLKHFKYALTGGRELGELWDEVEAITDRETDRAFTIAQKRTALTGALGTFNTAFRQLFIVPTAAAPNPEYILDHARPILEMFEHGLDIQLNYREAIPNATLDKIERNDVEVRLTYAGKPIPKPHLFLNEARLSAIAISIYFGMIKRHPQLRPYKILFLDDIFIGLDISNRLPLLNIIETHFPDYQVFITTYDKPWYEYVKSFLDGKAGWTTLEFYANKVHNGFEIPNVLTNTTDYLARATDHLNENDYKSAAVYTRTAFEKEVQKCCEKRGLKVRYFKRSKDYSSQDFWNAILLQGLLAPAVIADVEQYRDLVLNAFSHYNTEKHEIRRELTNAIASIRALKTALDAIP